MKFKNISFFLIFIISIFHFIHIVRADGVLIFPAGYVLLSLYFIPLLYLFTVAIEFAVFYIALGNERPETKDLFKTIALMNLLTNPLAQIFGVLFMILFPNYLFYFILLIEVFVILLESIFLAKKILEDKQTK